jgi:hypothetical protein
MDHAKGAIIRASPPHNDPPATLYHLFYSSTENRLTRWGVNSLSTIQPTSRAPYTVLYAAFKMGSSPSHHIYGVTRCFIWRLRNICGPP